MTSQPKTTYLTPEEYLAVERRGALGVNRAVRPRQKFGFYQTIKSLAEYVLIARDEGELL
jgi:hypothetical protein